MDSEGQRLDNFCCATSRACPRRTSTASSARARCALNKGPRQRRHPRGEGDVVRVPPCGAVADPGRRPAPAREFPILLEDEHLIAIDKPAGVAVHGGSGVSLA